jgi:hypothetical protein
VECNETANADEEDSLMMMEELVLLLPQSQCQGLASCPDHTINNVITVKTTRGLLRSSGPVTKL